MRTWNYEKTKGSLRGWLEGRKYYDALAALDLGLQYHTGERRDGMPEYSHQVSQATFLRSIADLLTYPEDTIVACLLHDLPEDHGMALLKVVYEKFSLRAATAVERLTNKEVSGIKKPKALYAKAQALDPCASIEKGVDRLHNHQTMAGAPEHFTDAKQIDYITETRVYILPMLKIARKEFPQQVAAYQIVRTALILQIELIEDGLIARNVAIPDWRPLAKAVWG